MQKINSNQNGFGLVPVLLITLIVAVVGFGGYNVYTNQHKEDTTAPTKTSSLSSNQPTSNFKTYENKQLGFKLTLPKDWQITDKTSSECGDIITDYDATGCPLTVLASPQSYLDAYNKKYGNTASNLLGFGVYTGSTKTASQLFDQFETEYASDMPMHPTPNKLVTYNGLHGFYVKQATSAYTDNIYVIQLSPGTYLSFNDREADSHNAQDGVTVDDTNDYTQYSDAVQKIVESVTKL